MAAETKIRMGDPGLETLTQVRDHVRTLEKITPITVIIPEGLYPFEKAVIFGPEDSGTVEAPITYRAEGQVTFDGAQPIALDQRAMVSEADELERLSPSARGQVVRIPVTDERLQKVLSNTAAVGTLIMQDGELLKPSRFPNVGFAHAKDLLEADVPTRFQKEPIPGTWEEPNGALFTLRESPAGTWEQWASEIEQHRRAVCFGYISAQWYRETTRLRSVDPEKGAIRFLSQTRYGLKKMVEKFQSRQAFLHLLCEIDEPGEWYFDVKKKALYLWPSEPLTEASRLALASADGFLRIRHAQHLCFEGFTVQGVVKGSMIEIAGGAHNRVSGCTLRHSTAVAITMSGTKNRVHGCDVYDVTRLARILGGRADEDEITPGGNEISNCHFYLSRLSGVSPTASLDGTGNIYRNNLFHNLPGQALVFRGIEHLIEHNEFFNIGFEEGDGATIYSGAQFWGYGSKIRQNFIHHIMSTDGLMTRSGIMLDDHDSGREVIENIFYKAGFGSLAVNGGTGHKIHGNIFLKGHYGVWIRIIGNIKKRVEDLAKFDSGELRRGDKHDYIWRCERVVGQEGWNREPWTRYPTFAKVMNEPNEIRFYPIENDVQNTIGWEMDEELTYGHPAIPDGRLVFKNTHHLHPERVFQDHDRLDFRYRPGARQKYHWLPNLPFKKIGLYLDDSRRQMPDKAKYRALVREHFRDRPSCDRRAKYDFDHVNETIYWNSGEALEQLIISR